MKKVLAVVGSPRHGGNTDLLVDAAIAGAQEAGAAVEKINVADLTIAPCAACGHCRDAAPGQCVQGDAMPALYPKIRVADALILGTPVYWWGPSAQLKLFIDRWYAFLGDGEKALAGKKAALICAMGDDDPATARHTVGMFRDIFDYLKVDFAGQLVVTANDRGEVAGNAAALSEAKELGRHLVSV